MSISWYRLRPCVLASSPWYAGLKKSSTQRRSLLTLAIESSADDTCVAILEKKGSRATLLFNKKVTSDNREFRGIHPTTAVISHTRHLAPLVQEALRHLPEGGELESNSNNIYLDVLNESKKLIWVDGHDWKLKPDFVSVTRGPGMTSNLATGLNMAKGLATAWSVPLVGVNHMAAHALTPRLVSALEGNSPEAEPGFPFLSLLVSGGHTLLVRSSSLCNHQILAEAMNIAIGDTIDKIARVIISFDEVANVENAMYGPLLEKFAFPCIKTVADYNYTPPLKRSDEIQVFDSGLGWSLTPPLSESRKLAFDFSGFNAQVQRIANRPDMTLDERRVLAKHSMRIAFEHLASRLIFVLQESPFMEDVKTVVVAGGVASNQYLLHILRSILDVRGFSHLSINSPPSTLCTDNAAMIAWTGMEMYEAGWRSEMDVLAIRKWPIDPEADCGGILGAGGWTKVNTTETASNEPPTPMESGPLIPFYLKALSAGLGCYLAYIRCPEGEQVEKSIGTV